MSTHNLCFGTKIRKNNKNGVYGGYTFHGHVFLMHETTG